MIRKSSLIAIFISLICFVILYYGIYTNNLLYMCGSFLFFVLVVTIHGLYLNGVKFSFNDGKLVNSEYPVIHKDSAKNTNSKSYIENFGSKNESLGPYLPNYKDNLSVNQQAVNNFIDEFKSVLDEINSNVSEIKSKTILESQNEYFKNEIKSLNLNLQENRQIINNFIDEFESVLDGINSNLAEIKSRTVLESQNEYFKNEIKSLNLSIQENHQALNNIMSEYKSILDSLILTSNELKPNSTEIKYKTSLEPIKGNFVVLDNHIRNNSSYVHPNSIYVLFLNSYIPFRNYKNEVLAAEGDSERIFINSISNWALGSEWDTSSNWMKSNNYTNPVIILGEHGSGKSETMQNYYNLYDEKENFQIIKQWSDNTFRQIMETTSKNDDERTKPLSAIVPLLDVQGKDKLQEKVLELTSNTQNEDERANILSAIVPILNGQGKEKLQEKVLDLLFDIQNDSDKANILSAIVPILNEQGKEELQKKALNLASTIQTDHYRAKTLSAIVPLLNGQGKEELQEKALDLLFDIQNDSDKANILSAIVPIFDKEKKEELMKKALEIASKIQDDYYLADALYSIVPHLDCQGKEELQEKVLDMTYKIQDDKCMTDTLYAIVPLLDLRGKEILQDKILEIVSKIQDDSCRAKVVNIILPLLDWQGNEELQEKALKIAFKIKK